MFDGVIEWFKGIFGGATEEMTQGVSDTLQGSGLDTAQETAQSFREDTFGGATEAAQGYGEEALGGATEAAQGYGEEVVGGATESVGGFQEQAEAFGGVVEDPGAAAADAARDQFGNA
ncbi:hypothetical protein DFP74_5096 [Nocardiopsis sp. Huas11]|uniref:hypothetical protein n=1 Tax=Nocardiopsis sp. Huas11 TaxID=2183912 RepID=UPI000EABB107|nr:hypothetical protein [Nocardiopsis sp. Huas11]RKS09361.1 hypothetical protein DFP74_5096 [Nocardiopsis sp. Huas11]